MTDSDWTIYVQATNGELYDIIIDKNNTFSDLRNKASAKVGIPFKDLVFVGAEEYDYSYNSKRLCDLGYPFINGITLYAVNKINGGNK